MGKTGFFDFHEQVRGRRSAPPPVAMAPATTPSSTPATTGTPAGPAALSVSELTARIDRAIRTGIPDTIYVRGEISNFRPNQASGHIYFTLKDPANCIECVMWKSDAVRLKFTPTDGIELLATAKVGVYGVRGRYQLYVTSLRPLGKGALELAFGQLRAKLEAEGLFHPDRKRPLPRFPRVLAIVTGADTAALQDILKVLGRFPWLRILLYPVPVQGQSAAPRIAAALTHLSRRGHDLGIELVLLARGGGSLEDLWAFNEEVVARAVADSHLPVVTGIGHEVDTTIADLIADYHAHTPTEAAQIVAGHWRTARDVVDSSAIRLRRSTMAVLNDARQRLANIERHETFRRPLDRINGYRQMLDDRQRALTLALTNRLHSAKWRVQQLQTRLDRNLPNRLNRLRGQLDFISQRLTTALSTHLRRLGDRVARAEKRVNDHQPKFVIPLHRQKLTALSHRLDRAQQSNLLLYKQTLEALDRQLQAVGPDNVLRRGYTITTRKSDGALMKSSIELKAGDLLITRFADGEVESEVQDQRQGKLFE